MPEILDSTVLDQLINDLDRDTVLNILGTFLAECEKRPAILQQYFQGKDFNSACREAHSMKSTAASFGAMRLSALGKSIEKALRENDPDTALRLFADVATVTRDTLDAFAAWKTSPKA